MSPILQLKFVDIPNPQGPEFDAFIKQAFEEADSLLHATASEDKTDDSWQTSSKVYNNVLGSDHRKKGEQWTWHARTSYHSRPEFDVFREFLYHDHAPNEKEYIHDMQKAELLNVLKPKVAEAWLNSYHLPFPTSNRDFSILILFRHDHEVTAGQRSFTIIQLPYDSGKQKGYVRGTYLSVEHVCETQYNNRDAVQWRMLVQSDPAGNIPSFVSEKVMTSTICKDVPMFLDWVKKEKGHDVSTESIKR